MSEEWRPVPGFEEMYEVSNHGRVRSWIAPKSQRPLVLKPMSKGTREHLMVYLCGRGKRKPALIHRLVLAAFIGPCPQGMEVRHLDGDPTHNHVENLRYGTHSENERDKVRHGKHRNAAKTECDHGHPFTPENTGRQASGRYCRECMNARARERVTCDICGASSHSGNISRHKRLVHGAAA